MGASLEFLVLCDLHLPTLKTSNISGDSRVYALRGPPPTTLCKYNKCPTPTHFLSHISWLFTCICLYRSSTSQKVGCGRMYLARLQPAIDIRKSIRDGQTLWANPLLFCPTPNSKCQDNYHLKLNIEMGFVTLQDLEGSV